MFEQTQITVQCPYCNHKNEMRVSETMGTALICCDNEDGGCDSHIAVNWFLSLSANVSTSKISWDRTS